MLLGALLISQTTTLFATLIQAQSPGAAGHQRASQVWENGAG